MGGANCDPSPTQNHEKKLRKQKSIGNVCKVQASARHNVANLMNLKQTNFKWQKGRKLGKLVTYLRMTYDLKHQFPQSISLSESKVLLNCAPQA